MAKPVDRPYQRIERSLSRRNPELRSIIKAVGPCTLKPDADHFSTLVHSILAQQISTRAAMTIGARLIALCGGKGVSAKAIADCSKEQLRSSGISAPKQRSLHALSEFALSSPNAFEEMHALDDNEVAKRLLPVHGIGPWTVEMFLIFSLGRLDVLPVRDLGLRAAVQDIYELPSMPGADELTRLAERWRPYRTIGTWYCWRSRGAVPNS